MKKENIDSLIKSGFLRIKKFEKSEIKAMLNSIQINMNVVINMPLNEDSATIIFREAYESIRQLGEAKWWIDGFELQGLGTHTISLDILKEIEIKEKVKLNYLDRFRKIRNDINYRAFRVSVSQADEILDFWNSCGREILEMLRKEI